MKELLLIVALSFSQLVSVSCSLSRQKPEYHSTRFPETRSMNEAKLWLHWSRAEQLAFVRGFVIAYKDGALRGCRMAFDALDHYTTSADNKSQPPDASICFSESARFDRTVEYYEDSVTSFYKTYPDDDDVPIRFLIEELSAHETPLQIHNALSPREP
jgi:hypothetical protein